MLTNCYDIPLFTSWLRFDAEIGVKVNMSSIMNGMESIEWGESSERNVY